MTIQQLKATHKAMPFQPFTLHMADGRSFPVPHPDFLSMSPTGRIAIVYAQDDECSILDLLLMTEIRIQPTSSARS